ncbi:MAG TPA: GNAT family N-acetyltransferase [Gaiellaceae bacterium]|nr:GNAT family N-acetyltransferase [Gaiellaceae bacterium]
MSVTVRPAEDEDRLPAAQLFAAVAEERDGIAAEPPIDAARWAERTNVDGMFVAVEGARCVAVLNLYPSSFGYGEIGMYVAPEWRGKGIGSALMEAAIAWARDRGLHKLTLSVFPHNTAAIALYRKFGFVEEGMHPKQMRRANGDLWDLVDMGLLL